MVPRHAAGGGDAPAARVWDRRALLFGAVELSDREVILRCLNSPSRLSVLPPTSHSSSGSDVRYYHQGSPGYRPGTPAPSRCRRCRIAARARQLALYQRGILSSGKAAALAGMNRWEWEELLGARKIPRHYSGEDLDRDIAYATRRK